MQATYSPDDNKLRLYASARLPAEIYERVKAHGFKWAPKQGFFVAPTWTPGREDLLIELCGEIGDEDKTLIERAEERADRFENYQEKRAEDAERAHAAVSAIADNIPLGQPILIGHHSERHARRDAEKIENGMRRAVKMWETSEYWKHRAASALSHAAYKERPDVRHRRIKTIEADKRKQERALAEARKTLHRWTVVLDDPAAWKPRADGSELTREERARYIANIDGRFTVSKTNADGTPCDAFSRWSAYDVLRPDGERYTRCPARTVDDCVEAAKRMAAAVERHTSRWIQHYDNRLEYERAMLGESGFIEPPKAPTRAALPLLNYRDSTEVKGMYGNPAHVMTKHDMTQAEYKAVYSDYKGTRTSSDGTHRVRTAYINIGGKRVLTAVFITDAKAHPKPGGEIKTKDDAEVAARIEKGQREIETKLEKVRSVRAHNKAIIRGETPPAPTQPAPDAAKFDALRDTLSAGVQVVSAPQLFPTPPELAARVVELAKIEPSHYVLEPSAGTGALLSALIDAEAQRVVSVEINPRLVECLKQTQAAHGFPSGESGWTITCADFLECNGDLGTFDRIIMNPPFTDAADIKHILHARKFLRPGGRLVAICANGPRQREKLQPLALEWIDLPADSFKASGTSVNTAIVIMDALT